MTKRRWAALLTVILMLTAGFTTNILVFARNCERLRNDVFRLHIIANSDSEEDQQAKLQCAIYCFG